MVVRSRRINIRTLEDPSGTLETLSNNMISDLMNRTAEQLQSQYGNQYKVTVGKKTISMSSTTDQKPIDLKEGFRNSPKAKQRVDKSGNPIAGTWYLQVPIRRKTRDMSRRTERFVQQHMQPGETSIADYLFEGRKGRIYNQFNPNKATRSKNITRSEADSRGRTTYSAIRTVSDKSPKNSWILNREIDRDVLVEDVNNIVQNIIDTML